MSGARVKLGTLKSAALRRFQNKKPLILFLSNDPLTGSYPVHTSPEPSPRAGKTAARRVGKPDDVSAFLVQNSLIFSKTKGSHQAAVGRASGSPEPRTRSIDRCAAADAAAVAAEAAS